MPGFEASTNANAQSAMQDVQGRRKQAMERLMQLMIARKKFQKELYDRQQAEADRSRRRLREEEQAAKDRANDWKPQVIGGALQGALSGGIAGAAGGPVGILGGALGGAAGGAAMGYAQHEWGGQVPLPSGAAIGQVAGAASGSAFGSNDSMVDYPFGVEAGFGVGGTEGALAHQQRLAAMYGTEYGSSMPSTEDLAGLNSRKSFDLGAGQDFTRKSRRSPLSQGDLVGPTDWLG